MWQLAHFPLVGDCVAGTFHEAPKPLGPKPQTLE